MPLLSLPNELLLEIANKLGSERDVHALSIANRQLYGLLSDTLYRFNIQNFGGSVLLWATRCGQEATMRKFLSADTNKQGIFYEPALVIASREGRDKIVELLLEYDTSVNVEDRRYGKALYAASCGGHEAIVRMLLDKGTDVNAQGWLYGHALQVASVRGHEAVMELLVSRGTDIDTLRGGYSKVCQVARS